MWRDPATGDAGQGHPRGRKPRLAVNLRHVFGECGIAVSSQIKPATEVAGWFTGVSAATVT